MAAKSSDINEMEIPETVAERLQKLKDSPPHMLHPDNPVFLTFFSVFVINLKDTWKPALHEKTRRELAWVCDF